MKKLAVIFTLFGLSMLHMVAQTLASSKPYVMVADGRESVNMSDSLFYEIASSVIFPVNKYDFPQDSKFAQELVSEVLPQMDKQGMQLESIIMRGAASPEGKHDWNTLLGQRRLQAVYDFINSHMTVPACEDCVQKIEVAEDYTYLLRMMKQAGDKDYETVKSVIDKYGIKNVVSIKRDLKKINGMRLWLRLMDEYFPDLRAARVVLVFKKAKITTDNQIAQVDLESKLGDFGSKAYSDSLFNDLVNKTKALRPQTNASQKATAKTEVVNEQAEINAKAENNAKKENGPKYPVLSVKTNLLYDALWSPKTKFQPTPNVEAEFYFRNGMFSILGEYEFPWWSNEEKKEFFQIQNWQIEPRYYFNHDHYFNGMFVGIYGMFNRFDFALPGNDGSGVQGEGAGAGASFGYVLPLGKKTSRWKLEFNVKAGYYETHYDPYDYEYTQRTQTGKYYYRWYDGADTFHKRNWRYRWFGPTGVGITISYDLWRSSKWPSKRKK